ncbi:MAG: DUF995 domain-containing protein [Rhodocyclaceae bacterium]|nr:DUF995 domain-containing protein [Rhodocyclaceae bacterium]
MFKNAIFLFAAVCAIPLSANAEDNLGTVLSAGATKLTADQIRSLVVGSRVEAGSPTAQFLFQPKEGGALWGQVRYPKISADGSGSWKITDDGRLCLKLDYANAKFNGTFDKCGFWFQQGDKYWVSGSDAEKDAPVHLYHVTK